jgi:hypothetical protein
MPKDDLTELLEANGYDVYVMKPHESAAEFITRVANQIHDEPPQFL